MSRPLRIEFPGSFWHITQRGNERRAIFRDDTDCLHFLELLGEAVRRFEWIVTAYALMLNHYHLALELTAVETLSRGLMWLDGQYARWFNWRHDRAGHLFQGRPGEYLLEKEGYYLEVLRYVVLNPVRASIVEKPEEYAWSSYRSTAGLAPAPKWLAVDRVLAAFAPDANAALQLYRQFVHDGIGSTKRPWDDAVGSMYVGSEDWLAQIRERVEERPRVTEHVTAQRELLRPTMPQIVSAVARTLSVSEENIRNGHGGIPRAMAAWIGCYESHLTNSQIAAALRLRSERQVTTLIAQCDRNLEGSGGLRGAIDRCIATLGRKNSRLQT